MNIDRSLGMMLDSDENAGNTGVGGGERKDDKWKLRLVSRERLILPGQVYFLSLPKCISPFLSKVFVWKAGAVWWL